MDQTKNLSRTLKLSLLSAPASRRRRPRPRLLRAPRAAGRAPTHPQLQSQHSQEHRRWCCPTTILKASDSPPEQRRTRSSRWPAANQSRELICGIDSDSSKQVSHPAEASKLIGGINQASKGGPAPAGFSRAPTRKLFRPGKPRRPELAPASTSTRIWP